MARLPQFLTHISPIGETLAAIGQGQALLEQETAARNDQLAVATATEGLALWERDCSLPDGAAMDAARRRSRVRTAMAGGQTLTKARLEELALTVGEADSCLVVEDCANWHVTLYTAYDGRLPADAEAVAESVERLKPAHLQVDVETRTHLAAEIRRHRAVRTGLCLHLASKIGELPA